MGFNTVAVLLNDHTHEIECNGERVGKRIAEAMRAWTGSRDDSLRGWFGAGSVVSMAHADYHQVVIVHGNTGQTVQDANDLPYMPLSAMAECLIRHGWTARPPAKKRKPREVKS